MNEAEIAAGLARTPGYRYAERVGDQLFLAGQVPLDGDGRLVGGGDVRVQAEQCLRNLFAIIAVNGFMPADVRRLAIHVVGPHDHLTSAWGVVTDWFVGDVPPATLLGAAALGYRGQLVEIDATVVKA
jgi:enamine deaminase RidA (YjgF/YER057c/UK114 family)